MYDHVGLNVKDYPPSKRFYDASLAVLGYGVVMAFPHACGYGPADKDAAAGVLDRPAGAVRHRDARRVREPRPGDGRRVPRGGARGRRDRQRPRGDPRRVPRALLRRVRPRPRRQQRRGGLPQPLLRRLDRVP